MGVFEIKEKEDNELSNALEIVSKLEEQLNEYKEIKKQCDDAKAKLKEAMEKHKVKEWFMPNGTKATLVLDKPDEDVEVKYFDEIRFKQEHGDLYKEYTKTRIETQTGKKGCVKIYFKKDDKDENIQELIQ